MTGRVGLLIDDKETVWADDSPELLRRLGHREASFDLAAYAVRNLGYIHLEPRGENLSVSLRQGAFSHETLIATLYQIVDQAPQRIMLRVFSGEDWSYEIFANLGPFTARAEAIVAGEPLTTKRWLAFRHDTRVLRSREYAAFRPMFAYWKACRARMGNDFEEIFRGSFFQQRGTLARKASRSLRFMYECFGTGIRTMLPCESLCMVGRDIDDAPDIEYARWVAESLAETVADGQPRIETIRARINLSDGGAIKTSYNRVLLPWRRGTDAMIMGLSILRERSVVL